jgi:hypothetical protein
LALLRKSHIVGLSIEIERKLLGEVKMPYKNLIGSGIPLRVVFYLRAFFLKQLLHLEIWYSAQIFQKK